MNKKAAFEMEMVAKFLLAVILILVLVVLISLLKGKGIIILDNIKSILRFGG